MSVLLALKQHRQGTYRETVYRRTYTRNAKFFQDDWFPNSAGSYFKWDSGYLSYKKKLTGSMLFDPTEAPWFQGKIRAGGVLMVCIQYESIGTDYILQVVGTCILL